ncbi:hypothetical protein EDWATA_01209 [Edwardsiella tarda ATCC 23685]|uniref:Uncharacterized protein n=1 Tax=Edwardsiella tarda ATCC 23685 TaxID=500638 RepID=D4F3A7_EDWTA|nr:hypothetical protein EDWATA_01209 [Edwardsiella tarda ATCC 23685]
MAGMASVDEIRPPSRRQKACQQSEDRARRRRSDNDGRDHPR